MGLSQSVGAFSRLFERNRSQYILFWQCSTAVSLIWKRSHRLYPAVRQQPADMYLSIHGLCQNTFINAKHLYSVLQQIGFLKVPHAACINWCLKSSLKTIYGPLQNISDTRCLVYPPTWYFKPRSKDKSSQRVSPKVTQYKVMILMTYRLNSPPTGEVTEVRSGPASI